MDQAYALSCFKNLEGEGNGAFKRKRGFLLSVSCMIYKHYIVEKKESCQERSST